MTPQTILSKLLKLELETQAARLQLTRTKPDNEITEEFLADCLDVLIDLSIETDEWSKKQLIAISALLWHYRKPEWDGLKDYLILLLSRAGFGPSSVMLDPGYEKEERVYSFSNSLVNELAIGVAQTKNEIQLGERTYLLTGFQKQLWESMEEQRLTGISAPTSAGKSFLILLKTIDMLRARPGTVVYVVPTLSLVNQVVTDFRGMLDRFGMGDYALETTYNISQHVPNAIYVFTQEKAIAAFSQADTPFDEIRLLVIDEVQNVERVENHEDMRAKVLYDLMMELRHTARIDHVIVSGPRINNIDELGGDLFGEQAAKMETSSSPVLNLTFSIINKKKQGYFLKVFSDLLEAPLEVQVTNEAFIKGFGGSAYQENYLEYLNELVQGFEDECTLLFSPTARACSKIADFVQRRTSHGENERLDDLAAFIQHTVHPDYALVGALRKGVAYHHGKLPSHVRPLIEQVIKSGDINIIIATTTLLQGVNLPVQNIIIRNPNLYTRKMGPHAAKLTSYELANLRGRAGRLQQDFIGRTFMLDENSFMEEAATQLDLFKGVDKELRAGYSSTYNQHKKRIKADIRDGVGKTVSNKEYSYITTYLRQAVLKYGLNAQTFLAKSGIILNDADFNDINDSLRLLQVDREVCVRNRYWDPVDLDKLLRIGGELDLPTSPTQMYNANRLKEVLLFMQDEFPVYYERYFDVYNTPKNDLLINICILADKWVKETPLATILVDPFYDTTEKIEETVDKLEDSISYGLALLLKPVYDIHLPESFYPRFIEMGAYQPLTRHLIEMNIPRQTAIYLKDWVSGINLERAELVKAIRRIRGQLPYWYQVQLQHI